MVVAIPGKCRSRGVAAFAQSGALARGSITDVKVASPFVLVEGGPSEAMRWRTGHMRSGEGHLPDLFFPVDRSWFVTALWDDHFACIGGSTDLIEALAQEPLAGVRRVSPDEDTAPPGVPRD